MTSDTATQIFILIGAAAACGAIVVVIVVLLVLFDRRLDPAAGLSYPGGMSLAAIKRRVVRVLNGATHDPVADFAVDPAEAKSGLANATTDLERLFYGNTGRLVHKWRHYLPIYERHLGGYRGKPFRMLEIGVFQGGSLELWRRYFGPEATLYGVDINPDCAGFVDAPNQVRIGSQADPDFLRSVIGEMGGLDIVLDDGSHVASHQRASFDALFPLLAEGGLYMIEDTHTAYWPTWEGGHRRPGTAIEFAKELIDEMHGWYHGKQARQDIGAISFHDSIIVIEKARQERPGHIQVG